MAPRTGVFDWSFRGRDEVRAAACDDREVESAICLEFPGNENLDFVDLQQVVVVGDGAGVVVSWRVRAEGLTTDEGPFSRCSMRGPNLSLRRLLSADRPDGPPSRSK